MVDTKLLYPLLQRVLEGYVVTSWADWLTLQAEVQDVVRRLELAEAAAEVVTEEKNYLLKKFVEARDD